MQTPAHLALIKIARAELGLNDVPSSWTYEQRTAYIKKLAGLIELNADQFTAAEVAHAIDVKSKAFPPLEDTSFDWAMFAGEVQANASPVLTTFLRRLYALAAIAAVGVGLYFVITLNPRRYTTR